MSNHHTRHNYYQTILDNKHAIATSEFGVKPKLLTINIDLGDLDDNFEINESHIKSVSYTHLTLPTSDLV